MSLPSRRDFLKLTTASLALLAGGASARLLTGLAYAQETTPAGRELILLCDSDTEVEPKNNFRITHKGAINIFDVAANTVSAIEIPFFGHTTNQHPKHPELVVTFEKWGKRGALVDVKNKKLVSLIASAEGKSFFGHAAFNTDGSVMAVTENNYQETEGLLSFRDTSSMKVVGKCSSYGVVPHECRTPDGGKTIMVVNKGDKRASRHAERTGSNISWIDWNSGKLINQVAFDRNNNVLYGHCDMSFDSWVCVSGVTEEKVFSDLIVLISPDGQLMPVKLPKNIADRMKGEALSIAFLGHSGLVGVTVTKANLVLLIDYKTQELVEAIHIPIPNGILPVLDGNDVEPSMLVTSKQNRNISVVSTKKGASPDVRIMSTAFGGIGTHLSRIYV